MKTALVCGAGGFIGSHLVTRLKKDGYYVVGADLKYPEFKETDADKFYLCDLRERNMCVLIFGENKIDEVYQLAADMGGAGYIFSGENDAYVMHNSAQINLNIAYVCGLKPVEKIFYSSSACMYPQEIQRVSENTGLKESDAYPANPDSEYGWEKLFSERLYLAYARNKGFNIRIARFHNIFGIYGTYKGGKEKAPAAMCRKVASAEINKTAFLNDVYDGEIEVWGDGLQTRSFLYIDDCIDGIIKLMKSDCKEPVNIGSDEMVSINELAQMVIEISGKNLQVKNIESKALGVRGRNSDNTLIEQKLDWKPTSKLKDGLIKTYEWINSFYNPV